MPPLEDLPRDELVALLVAQAETIGAQAETITALQARIAQLERKSTRNSGNSSLPPSTDDAIPGRPKPERRSRAGKSVRGRGKQPGADGTSLAWDDNAAKVACRPVGRCGCGADLAGAADVRVVRSHQVVDVPLVTATTTQYDLIQVRCPCGREHAPTQPAGVPRAPVSYGPNLQSLVLYLLVFQHLPVERAGLLVQAVTGAAPSTGFVHGMLARGAAAVTDAVAAIKEIIVGSKVVGFDETTLRVGPAGEKQYVLSASTRNLVVFGLGGRDLESFRRFGVLTRIRGIAVHDRLANYFHKGFTGIAGHQACCSHLIRDLEDAVQSYPDAVWPVQAQQALIALIHASNIARDTAAETGCRAIPPQVRDPLVAEFRSAVRVGLAQVPPTDDGAAAPGRALLEFLRDHEDSVLRFTLDLDVWPTNNQSERDLRPHKTQQKVSGRLTSEDVTEDRLDLRSYVTSAIKNGQNALTVLRDALLGHPWIPPAPA